MSRGRVGDLPTIPGGVPPRGAAQPATQEVSHSGLPRSSASPLVVSLAGRAMPGSSRLWFGEGREALRELFAVVRFGAPAGSCRAAPAPDKTSLVAALRARGAPVRSAPGIAVLCCGRLPAQAPPSVGSVPHKHHVPEDVHLFLARHPIPSARGPRSVHAGLRVSWITFRPMTGSALSGARSGLAPNRSK